MCDMGNKLWYERDLCSCDSFTRHLLVVNPTGTRSLWHLVPNVGPGAFCLCESKTVENAQKCKKWFPVQLTLLHEHSVFWGWKGPTRGQKCCHVVRGSQGLPSWFQGPGGPSSAAMWSWVLRGYPGDSKGHEAQNCIQPPRAQGEGLEPLLAAQETVSEAQSLRPVRGSENDISLGLEKHMVSQKRLNQNFILSFYWTLTFFHKVL